MKKEKNLNKRKGIDRGKKRKKRKGKITWSLTVDTKASSYLIRDNSATLCAHMRKVQCAARVYLELKRTLNCVHFNHQRTLNHTVGRFSFTCKTREDRRTYRWITRLLSRLARKEGEKEKQRERRDGAAESGSSGKEIRRTMMVVDGAEERRRRDRRENGGTVRKGKEVRRNACDRS